MMDFNFHYQDLTPFLDKLKNNELTLENILEEEEIIDDIRNNTESQFINFFTNDKIKKLIDYSIKLPASDSHNIGYKYPFNATEILCSENKNFQNQLMCQTPVISKDEIGGDSNSLKEKLRKAKYFRKEGFISILFNILNKVKKDKNVINTEENESDISIEGDDDFDDSDKDDNKENKKPNFIYENVDYLLQFLKEPDETKENYVLVGYFYKILNNLISIHSTKIVQYLLDYPKKDEFDILGLFIKNMNRKSMCNIIYKLLVFEGEINTKFDDKKLYLIEKILDELNESNDIIKCECICDSLCLVMNNSPFFNLFINKLDLLEKLYQIFFNSKNNTKKINSILKLLIKINENILQRFEVHYTSNTQENNNEVNLYNNVETCYSNDQDKSITSRGDNSESLKNILFFLFDILEKQKLKVFEDFGNFNQEENNEFKATYMEKQKKIGMKKIMQTEYLQTLIEIIVNSYASKYHETKIEKLIDITKDINLFWNLHTTFFLFPFSNIFQIYYNRIIEIVLNEHSPNCLIEAFFMEYTGEKKNLIELYIEKIITDMKFNFDLTKTKSFNPCFSFATSLINKIYNCQNINVKKIIEDNKNLSTFYDIVGKEINNVYTQKLLLNTTFDFGDNEEDNLNYFGPETFLESFEENCKIYEAYKNGDNYQKLLSDKKERIDKDKDEKKTDKEKVEKNMGLEYIDDIDNDYDDPLFKIEKINSNKDTDKDKDNDNDNDNFLSILNKNQENDNNIDIIDDDDEKDKNILNIENIDDEMGKMNEDSIPNQIENKIYHVDYEESRNANKKNL